MNRTHEAMVGVVIVGALVLTVAGTLWLQGMRFGQDRQTLEVVVAQAGQIMPGNSVKYRGVDVGRVGEVSVEPGGAFVRIELLLEQPVALPPDPVVILSPESLFGDWEAEIESRTELPYGDYPVPSVPGVLPGYALPDISELTAMADRISTNLAALTDRLGVAFSEETAERIASLIANVEEVTTGLSELVRQQAVSFTEITDGVQAATDEVASAADQIRSTFETADGLLGGGAVDSTLANLAAMSGDLRALSGELGETNAGIRAMAARIDSTFARLESVTATLDAGDGTMGRLLSDTEMAGQLQVLLVELATLLEDIRENPDRYVRISIF